MSEKIEFEVSGFSGLKAQIREATLEYQALLASVDATPEAVNAAASKVANLKDQFNDANDAVQAMTQQGRFQAFTKGLAAVSGGFTAVQGAISLVSNDTKAFEKTFQKLQAAMALTQGLTALADLGDAFGAMKVAAVSAFNGIKAAIGSTGVGLLIVGLGIAVGALINYFNEASEAEEENKKTIDELNLSLERAIALSDDLSRRRANQLKIDEANAKLAGKSIQEISDIRQKAYIKDRDSAIQNVKDINAAQDRELSTFKGTEEEKKKITDKYAALRQTAIAKRNNAETALSLEQIDVQQQILDKGEADRNKALQKSEEKAKKAQERRIRNLEAQRDLELAEIERFKLVQLSFATTEAEKVKIENDSTQQRLTILSKFETDRETLRAKDEQNAIALEAKLKDLSNQRQESTLKTQQELTKIAKDEEEKRKKNAEEAAQKAIELAEKELKRKQEVTDIFFKYKEIDAINTIDNEKELSRALEQIELDRLEKQMSLLEEGSAEQLALEAEIAQKKKDIRNQDKEDAIQTAMEIFQGVMDATKAVSDAAAAFQERDKQREIEALKKRGLAQEEFAKEEDAINKEYFEKNKKVQVANAIIQALQSSVSSFASLAGIPVVGPALGAIAAAAALAAGYATVQKIQETTYTSSASSSSKGSTPEGSMYAEGGMLSGRSHDLGGIRTNMGELEGGEFVINRRATANFLPLLEAINSQGNTPGPEVGQYQQPIIKTYVVASDVSSQQEANAKLNALARL